MKTLRITLLTGVIFLGLASCKKGECTCTVLGSEVSTSHTADDRDEYNEMKSDCESAGCDWKPKI